MRTANRRLILGVSALAALAGVSLTGCADITPELDTRSQRSADITNRIAITTDTNLRLFNEDLGRALLMDRPSRLTPSPVPY